MRRHFPLVLLTVLPMTLIACGDSTNTTADITAPTNDTFPAPDIVQPVTLVLDWTPNTNHGGIYLADANGWYEEAGIDLEIIQPGSGGGLQAVASGSAEFAIDVQENVVPAQAEGVPVVSVAAIVQHNTSSLMALADSGIGGPADLPGHRYGGWGGPLERALVDRLVECGGGDRSGVEFVEVGNTDYRVGLESGAFDFVWVFDGWDKLRLEQAGVDVNTIPFIEHTDCIPDWYTPLIATSSELATDDPDLVAAFIGATSRGYEAAIADPGAAADALLAAAPELDEQLVRASAEYLAGQFTADAPRWGEQSPEVWEAFVGFLTDEGLLTEPPTDISGWFTNDFLPGAPDAFPTTLQVGTHCGVRVLGLSVDGRRWLTDEAGDVRDWMPAEWREAASPQELLMLDVVLNDDGTLAATAAGRTVVYREALPTDELPDCA